MNYWVIRGAPRDNDFTTMFAPGRDDLWRTASPPKSWAPGDRLFFWASSPAREIVALGEFRGVTGELTEDGQTRYAVRYLTGYLNPRVGIAELRNDPVAQTAIFLKLGPAASVVRLSVEEGARIYELVRGHNPDLPEDWSTNVFQPSDAIESTIDIEFAEGTARLREHLVRERSRAAVTEKKRTVLRQTGRLTCEVCDFDFAQVYGDIGVDFAEVHHRLELSSYDATSTTRLTELAIVCANCHRMLHRGEPVLSIEELRHRVRHAKLASNERRN